MHIVLIEAYYGGSHRAWANELQAHSQHSIHLLTMPAQYWKWRMQGGALSMARLYQEAGYDQQPPDLILITDMINVATFRALISPPCPIALYFHENQLTYPQNSRQKHGWRYGFINAVSALASDAILFSSQYHHDAFFHALPNMLKHFADYNELSLIDVMRQRSHVLRLALDLRRFDAHQQAQRTGNSPLIVWNHRWEEDKQPSLFADTLLALAYQGHDFRVALLGEKIRQTVPEFDALRAKLGARVVQYGYAESFAQYAGWLWQADYIVSTAVQEFFGIAVAEGMYCGAIPILPERLNYPALVPSALHPMCLYARDGALETLLGAHLRGDIVLDEGEREGLRQHIASVDWGQSITTYDARFTQIVAQGKRPLM